MKIKTIWSIYPDKFDAQVNEATEAGWRLARREVLPDPKELSQSAFYAELVLPDPVPEPEQGDPVEALRCIRDFCKAMPLEKCLTPECPLFNWCHLFTEDGVSPMDWPIPGEEACQ